MDKCAPLGVYDSGVGGLDCRSGDPASIVQRTDHLLGGLGPPALGDRTPQEIQFFARQIITFLVSRGVKMVVIACNTSSALALPIVRKEFSLPLIGMIEPGVKAALRMSEEGKVG